MKSDSERQSAYQQRRRKSETRVVVWLSNETVKRIEMLCRGEPRSGWIERAVDDAIKLAKEPAKLV